MIPTQTSFTIMREIPHEIREIPHKEKATFASTWNSPQNDGSHLSMVVSGSPKRW